MEQYSLRSKKKKNKAKTHSTSCSKIRSGDLGCSVSEQMHFQQFDGDQTLFGNEPITPYACFYGPSVKKAKAGWLDKLSPQGYGICSHYCIIVEMYVCMRDVKFAFGHCLLFLVGKRAVLLQEHRVICVFNDVTYSQVYL